MAWTAPMTAVSGNAFTISHYNTHIRDNLLETMPAKATTAGNLFAATGANALAERVPSTTVITTSQTLTGAGSTSFTDLATVGPAVTVTTGARALVMWSAQMTNNTSDQYAIMSVTVSGATTDAASDTYCTAYKQTSAQNSQTPNFMGHRLYTALTPGSNTFTAKYRITSTGSQGTFSRRTLVVIPF